MTRALDQFAILLEAEPVVPRASADKLRDTLTGELSNEVGNAVAAAKTEVDDIKQKIKELEKKAKSVTLEATRAACLRFLKGAVDKHEKQFDAAAKAFDAKAEVDAHKKWVASPITDTNPLEVARTRLNQMTMFLSRDDKTWATFKAKPSDK